MGSQIIGVEEMSDICTICKRPVINGEARYTPTDNHYSCEFPNGQTTLDDLCRELGIDKRKPRKREGTGKTAIKAQNLAVAALALELDAELFDVLIWNQQGAYRGVRWDLDRWGLQFSFIRDGHTFSGQASSLATMTACVKAGAMKASAEGSIAFMFSIDPV